VAVTAPSRAAGEVHALDNPVWGSVVGAHADLADVVSVGDGRAGRYQTDVAPFGAVEDPADPACWEALAELLAGHATCLLVEPAGVPAGWEVVTVIPGVQMDGTGLEPAPHPDAATLTAADVPDMLELVRRTKPGPYLRRTIEMGRYVGIRREGELIAMAGQRLHPPGWAEISAVCTDPRHRGEGLGTALVRAMAATITSRGELPFLHAAADNTGAIRLYEALGFTVRRTLSFTILKERSPGGTGARRSPGTGRRRPPSGGSTGGTPATDSAIGDRPPAEFEAT
jgi:ribosomal protein S18 acetylase RimI-like enzyme